MFFQDLTPEVRVHMATEVADDIANDKLCMSKRFSLTGKTDYPAIMQQAVQTEELPWLIAQLSVLGRLNTHETTEAGQVRKVRYDAAQTFSEGEFNRFYMRGLCIFALSDPDAPALEVYRAKEAMNPRFRSEDLCGTRVDPKLLLADLRENVGLETFLGVPGGVGSGISVRIVHTVVAAND